MATYTTNINLKKPTTSEMYNVLDWNDNSDKIDAAYGALNSQIASDWGTKTTTWLASVEQDSSGCSAVFSKAGKSMTISITTASRAHSENDTIATIESGFRPNVAINAIGYINGVPCVVRFATDGTVKIWLLSETTTGRLYVCTTYAVPN